jgi:hypothetical protein
VSTTQQQASGSGPPSAAPSAAAAGGGSGDSGRSWLKDLSTLLGAIGGSIGLIYATGGLVLGLRLFVHHFSFGPVIGQLPREFLLSFGFSEVVLPAAVVAGLYGAAHLLHGRKGKQLGIRRWSSTDEEDRHGRCKIFLSALTLTLIGIAPAVVLTSIRYDWKRLVALVAGFLLLLIVSLVLLELRAIIYTGKGGLLYQVALMTLLVGVWTMPCFILLWANIELPAAVLCTTSGEKYKGVLIGETANRDYLGANPQPKANVHHHRLISLPLSQVEALFVGHEASKLSCPPPTHGS